MPNKQVEKCIEYLKHVFSEIEKKELADQMVEASVKVREVEGNLKSISTQLKAEINKHKASLDQASEKYRSGFEYRDIKCEATKDFKAGTLTIIRLDTGEIIKERVLDGEEKQTSMFREEGNHD